MNYICKKVQSSFNLFRIIRKYLSLNTAQLYVHTVKFSHLSYITSWLQASQTTLKPVISLYNQIIKILDKKPIRWHYCHILEKHNMFNFESFISFCHLNFFSNVCLAPSLFNDFVTRQQDAGRVNTRPQLTAIAAFQCTKPHLEKPFSLLQEQNFGTVCQPSWNTTQHNLKVFNKGITSWLKEEQCCSHT